MYMKQNKLIFIKNKCKNNNKINLLKIQFAKKETDRERGREKKSGEWMNRERAETQKLITVHWSVNWERQPKKTVGNGN